MKKFPTHTITKPELSTEVQHKKHRSRHEIKKMAFHWPYSTNGLYQNTQQCCPKLGTRG